MVGREGVSNLVFSIRGIATQERGSGGLAPPPSPHYDESIAPGNQVLTC